ncbi:aspartate--tRNA ligase, partial [bacterium]
MAESMQGLKRTHQCGHLTPAEVGQEVTLMGWVNTRRDHGGLIFIDLRDRSGIIQLVVSPEVSGDAFAKAEKVRSEFVLAAVGKVRRRDEDKINPNL